MFMGEAAGVCVRFNSAAWGVECFAGLLWWLAVYAAIGRFTHTPRVRRKSVVLAKSRSRPG